MPDFMEGYGVADARRGRTIKRTILIVLAVAIAGTAGYFYFRTWSQKQAVNAFFEKLESKDFAGAYAMWCKSGGTCEKYYPFERFQEDWGESTPYAQVANANIDNVEYCGEGVIFNISYPNAEPVDLMVQRSDNVIGFSPWKQCPGRRLTLRPLMERLFGSSNSKG